MTATLAPTVIDAGPVQLRHVGAEWSAPLASVINESLDHLRPWMDWAQAAATADSSAMYLALQHERFVAGEDLTWLIFEGDDIVGGCGLHVRQDDVRLREIGYWLRPDVVGRGLATAAARALLRLAFVDLGLSTVVLRCALANDRSAAVARRLGFEHVGDDGGTMFWHLRVDDWKDETT